FQVLGIDISPAMVEIAKNRAPDARFQVLSLIALKFPRCVAVTAFGEGLNYTIDSNSEPRELSILFARIYEALIPGGMLLFDIAEPGKVKGSSPVRTFTHGEGWVVLVEKEEDKSSSTLVRRITTFRKTGIEYRRADEVHRQRLYKATNIAKQLRRQGFRVRV